MLFNQCGTSPNCTVWDNQHSGFGFPHRLQSLPLSICASPGSPAVFDKTRIFVLQLTSSRAYRLCNLFCWAELIVTSPSIWLHLRMFVICWTCLRLRQVLRSLAKSRRLLRSVQVCLPWSDSWRYSWLTDGCLRGYYARAVCASRRTCAPDRDQREQIQGAPEMDEQVARAIMVRTGRRLDTGIRIY